MANVNPNLSELQRFFETLYGASDDGWLVLSYPDPRHGQKLGKPALLSEWRNLAYTTLDSVARDAAKLAEQGTVYHGCVIQEPTCQPGRYHRGKHATAYQAPGLWLDLDLAYGQHAASALPVTDAEALDFLRKFPAPPSLILHSGGGLYAWWLFREPFTITRDAERRDIAHLSKRFTHTVCEAGKQQQWTLDALGDLARVLRPPGSINYKYGKLVTLLHEGAERYNPSDFDAWLLPLPPPQSSHTMHTGTAVGGQLDIVRVAEAYGATLGQKSTTELCGAHPVHGSSTGDNFNVNPTNGLWHCWRHGTGGDALTLIAVCENLLECDKATSGALSGRLFPQAVDIANQKFQAGITLGPTFTPLRNAGGAPTPQTEAPLPLRRALPPPEPCPLSEDFITVAESGERKTSKDISLYSLTADVPWPQCAPEAYSGLAGEIVRCIEPHTESDPVGLLVQLLTMVGNAMARAPYFPVEADRHYMNLFTCLVGESSKGRKGTSAGYPKRLLTTLDAAWGQRVMGGLSSGEGVIWNVRDPVYGKNKKGEDECLDEGVQDKRLCILESEFARALAKTGQEGNVLSAVLRQAWDHGDLRTLVSGRQKAPVVATGAHISVVAHITAEELRRLLTETEAANGFGNRFLWVCVRRSKLLPEGGMYHDQALAPLAGQLTLAIQHARTVARMQRSEAARVRWKDIYTELAEGQPGLLGAITARAEAQVLRLSCLYALLDGTGAVDTSHLDAAYALWGYCQASARYIFGDMLGDPVADDIRRLLQQAAPAGLTRTDLSNAFGRHAKSAAIGQALAHLQRDGYARCTVEKTTGRPVETWFACTPVSSGSCEKSEKSEKSPSSARAQDSHGTLNALNSLNSHMRISQETPSSSLGPCAHSRTQQEPDVVCLDCGLVLKEASPPTVQHDCPRCGEVRGHSVGPDGFLLCTWCSTLPDDQVFTADDGGTLLGLAFDSVPTADDAVEYEELT